MTDPFQRKHASDSAAEKKKEEEEAAKQHKAQVAQRVAAIAIAKAKPANPNRDIGYPWPKKFYDPTA